VPMDRSRLAARLVFGTAGEHTRHIMWAADGLADAVVAASQAATTVDRLAEDLEIFASPGFGYVTLDASLCRASVLMPQKRNPYALAVIRAGAGTLVGRATGLLVTQRTPSARTDNWLHAYGEVAGALDLARRIVALGAEVTRTLVVDRDALAAAAGTNFTFAADLAEELVLRHALDYRSAYRVVGRAVTTAIHTGRTTLTTTELSDAATDVLGHPVTLDPTTLQTTVDPARIVAGRTAPGGSAPSQVRAHANTLSRRSDDASRWRVARRHHSRQTEQALITHARRLVTGGQASAAGL
jgi:argininosuccinate lyase